MECVILAAGVGTRMRPYTDDIPKPMIPFLNKSLLEHTVRKLRRAGIHSIKIVVGYKKDIIENFFRDGRDFGVRIEYIEQEHQSGTATALLCASEYIRDDFLVVQGDSVISGADLERIPGRNPPVIGIYPSATPEKYGVVGVDNNNIVTSLVEKPPVTTSLSYVNTGTYLFTPEIFEILASVEKSCRGEYELTDALQQYILHKRLAAYQMSQWYDISSPWDLITATEAMLKDGPHIGKNVTIDPTAYIEKEVMIGDNTTIWRNAVLRGHTVIGKNCYIGNCSEVKNSIIFDNTHIPHFNYVGDSLIGSGCNLGAGTNIANLRHDSKNIIVNGVNTGRRKFGAAIGNNVKTGINCSINCGSIIGNGVRIAPHTYIEK